MYSPSTSMNGSDPLQIENRKRILVSQIICVVMIAGLLVFTTIAFIVSEKPRPPVITYVGLVLGLVQIVLRFVIPGAIVSSQMKRLTETDPANLDSALFAIFQTKLIIGLALLDGAGLFNGICYIVEQHWWTIAFMGVLVFLMAMMFPTLNQFESWVEDRKRDLQNQF